jgi:5-bromo-4-chloroindolyl phosphate hydrolysis protein
VGIKKGNPVFIIIPLVISIAVFGILIITLHWSLFIAALLAAGLYLGLSFLLTPVFKLGGVNIDSVKNKEEIIALLEEGERDLSSIKRISDTSKDHQIREKALAVYREGGKIIEYIKKNPHKAVLARRFFNYYLDKANDILTKYDNLITVDIETEHLTALKTKTINALESISRGMNFQFSKLISSELIDIEADIKLLENTIKTEDYR